MVRTDWTLKIWDFWFGLPIWQAILISILIAPVGLWVWRGVIQGIWVNPLTHDWWASNFDVFHAGGVVAMLWLARTMPAGSGHHDGWMYLLLNYGSLAFWLAFAVFKWWDERNDVECWSRRLGATTVYHIGVLMYVGGLYTILLVNTWTAPWLGPTQFAMHVAPLLAGVAWLFAGMVLDPKYRTAPNGDSKFIYTSPADGWRNVRILLEWIFRFSGLRFVWRWLRQNNGDLASELGVLRPWYFIFNREYFQFLLVLLFVSPGAFFVLNAVMRGEWVPLSHQWMSALAGDELLAIFGLVCFMMLRASIPTHGMQFPVFKHRWPHYAVVAFWCCFGYWHMWSERGSNTLQMWLGPNPIYHNFVVYPLLGYALTVLFVAALKFGDRAGRIAVAVAFVVCVGGWGYLGIYDSTHQYAPGGISKHEFANPTDGWRNLRLLGEWAWPWVRP